MLYWSPEEVRTDRIVQDEVSVTESLRRHPDNYQHVERRPDDPHVAPRVTQRKEIEVGVMGYPEKANANVGRQVCEEMVQGLVELIRKIQAENPEQRREGPR
jgi:creatinine amidohydrolase/Fe(II)-dependent formamide hydrolase-like protein